MPIVKKLIFAPFFLLSYLFTLYQLNPLFTSSDLIFSLSANTLILFLILSALILATSFFFVLLVCLSDWKIILPIVSIAAVLPLIVLDPNLGFISTIGTLISLGLIYFALENNLKTYLTFQPTSILGPSIRHLSTLLVIIMSISYFLSINKVISEQGFEIPDSLIDSAISLTTSQMSTNSEETPSSSTPQISKEQIELLKKNPDLLKQYGLDPSILDTLDQPQTAQKTNPSNELVKQAVKDQLQNVINPYINFVPGVLALLLFITLTSFTSFLTILIYPILWLIFYIFEKSGFVKFTTETRSVKKMVI